MTTPPAPPGGSLPLTDALAAGSLSESHGPCPVCGDPLKPDEMLWFTRQRICCSEACARELNVR